MMDDENLPEIPRSWVWTRLGEIAQVIRGASPRPKGNPKYFGGDIPWIMISDISKEEGKYISETRDTVTNEGAKKSRYLKAGTLILSNSGTVCVPKILAVDGCIHDGFVAFPNLTEDINILYLYYFFDHIRPKVIQENRQGVTQINLNTSIVKEILIPLPPLPEQQRIVAKIEELFTNLDAGMKALEKVKTQLKRYRQAILKYAFEGKLTREWRELHKEELEPASVLLKKIKREQKKSEKKGYTELSSIDLENLRELPHGWILTRAGEITESMKNGIYKPKRFYSSDGIACLRMYNIENGSIIWKDIKRIKLTTEEIQKYELKPGDILVNRVNSRELVGKAAPIPLGLETCVYESKNIRLRLFTDYVESKYVSHWFQFFSQQYFNRNAQQTVGMASINQKQLSSMPIPLPPFAEQRRIVEEIEQRFSIADEIEKTVEHMFKKAKRLRQGILKKAFEGKLVPQNPNDEPAHILLERIKTEKTKKKQRKFKRKKEKYRQKRLINYGA